MLNCTPIEYCMGNISGLSDSELLQMVAAIQTEQNARKNKKRQELINKTIAALHDLQVECQVECLDGCITVYCEDCDHAICLTLDEIAEKIKYVE